MVAAHPDKFELALTVGDAARINAAGKKIVYMSIENSYELGEDLSLLDTFYKLGVRMAGPVHNGTNQLADSTNPGALGMKWGGLSPDGPASIVKRANELGIVLDGSHSSDATIEQMIDLSATPIILSHHGARPPQRAPAQRARRAAEEAGGQGRRDPHERARLVHQDAAADEGAHRRASTALRTSGATPTCWRATSTKQYLDESNAIDKQFPENRATFEDYMAQVLYTIKLIGVDHVGFGADWDGGGGLDGFRDITALPKITERLLKEGYTEADLRRCGAATWSAC